MFEMEDIDEDAVYAAYKHELVKTIDLPTLNLGQEGKFADILGRLMPERAVPTAEAAVPDSVQKNALSATWQPQAGNSWGWQLLRLTQWPAWGLQNTNEQTK